MKKLLPVLIIAVFAVSGVALAQYVQQVQPPRCAPNTTLKCTNVSYLGITACDCVNPTTNAIVTAYSYTPTQVNAMVSTETAQDNVVNTVVNAAAS